MSFSETLALALFALFMLFALIFVLAGVEGRMFDQVMVEPETTTPEPAALEAAPALSQAA